MTNYEKHNVRELCVRNTRNDIKVLAIPIPLMEGSC